MERPVYPKATKTPKIRVFFFAAPPCSRPLAAPLSSPRRSMIPVVVIMEIMGRMDMMSTVMALPIPVDVLVATTAADDARAALGLRLAAC